MNPRPNRNLVPISDEVKARLIEMLKPKSNVVFVDFKNKK